MVILYGCGFIVRPKSVLRSSSCPGTFSICSPWSSVVRKMNISSRANPSPRQRLFPMPKMRTFSVRSLLRCPDTPRKRSGRNVSGSTHRSLRKSAKHGAQYGSKTEKKTHFSLRIQSHNIAMIAHGDSRIMIDLILVDEDTRIFRNEISIQHNVPCGTEAKETRRFNT